MLLSVRWARLLLVGVALLGSALLSGCVSTVRYPDDWAPIASAPNVRCAHLTGTYANQGLLVEPDMLVGWKSSTKVAFLVDYLMRPGGRLLHGAASVGLNANDDNRLTLSAIHPDGRRDELTLERAKGQFDCRDGAIVIGEGQFGVAYVAIVGGRESVRLARATDGALIVENHAWGVGTAMVVLPIGFSSRELARFAMAEPVAPK